MPSLQQTWSLRSLARNNPEAALKIAAERGFNIESVFQGMFSFFESIEIKSPKPCQFARPIRKELK